MASAAWNTLFSIPAPPLRRVTDNRTKSWRKQEVCMCVSVYVCMQALRHIRVCMHKLRWKGNIPRKEHRK